MPFIQDTPKYTVLSNSLGVFVHLGNGVIQFVNSFYGPSPEGAMRIDHWVDQTATIVAEVVNP